MRNVLWLSVLAGVLIACKAPILHPRLSEYPCGVNGLPCGNGLCCYEGETCGGLDPTCPSEMCCYVGFTSIMKPRVEMHSAFAESINPEYSSRESGHE